MQFRRQSLNLNTILYQCSVIVLLQQLLDVRLPVQDLPAKLDIGNPSLVPVILQAPAADLQRPGKLPVGQEPFPVEGRTVVTGKTFHFFLHVVQQGKEPAGTFVLLVDNAFHLFRSLKVSVLSSLSHSLLLASDADVGYQPLHVFGLVIELALEAGERQPSSHSPGSLRRFLSYNLSTCADRFSARASILSRTPASMLHISIISTCLNVSANIREETMRGKRDRYTGRNSHG